MKKKVIKIGENNSYGSDFDDKFFAYVSNFFEPSGIPFGSQLKGKLSFISI